MASASAQLDIKLESVITTPYTCQAAVYLDPSPSQKETLQKYLLSACVHISTISKALGSVESEEVDTKGQAAEEICQELLEKIQIKIEYFKNRNKNNHVVKILHKFAVEKMNPK